MLGTLIDCYRKGDSMMLWIRQGDKNIELEDTFTLKLYVRSDNLQELRHLLYKNGMRSTYTKKKTFFPKEVTVLEIPLPPCRYRAATTLIEKLTNYGAEIYNADLHLEEYYFFEKNLFPLAQVEYNVQGNTIKSIRALDSADDLHYQIPKFIPCNFRIETKDNLLKGFDTQITKIHFESKTFRGTEAEMLHNFKECFCALDPDVLWTANGNLVIPFLSKKFQDHGIAFSFNRFQEDDFVFKKGRHHMTYGKMIYRTHSIFLKGRLHFDTHSFFAHDSGYFGIVDTARACFQTIQRAEMRSAGACVNNLLLKTAYDKNFLLPYKLGLYERFKTMEQLYEADRGSFIFEPRVGFHSDVAEFDFVSLYPNIMNKQNLSPETLFCACCTENKVPNLHYHYCTKEKGVVSIVAHKLIQRRMELKKEQTPQAKEKRDALKWLLVTMFGYQAFVHRKIGIIETHESIQAYARQALLKAVHVAEHHDFEVVHGIIDSLYLKKQHYTEKQAQRLGKELFATTNLEVSYEGRYKWIVFLPSINNKHMPIANRFYGVFENGDIKVRGLEARRKDAPKIIQDMQMEMIEKLAQADNEEQFRALFPKVFSILKNYISMIDYAQPDELAIARTLSKKDYKSNIPQKSILHQMTQDGYDIEPGMRVRYIIADAKNKHPGKRYTNLEAFDGRIDKAKYIELMAKAVYGMLSPFILTLADIYCELQLERQMIIPDYVREYEKPLLVR